jgi:hypothetical protein
MVNGDSHLYAKDRCLEQGNPLRDIGLVEKESTPRDVSGLVLLPKMDVLDGEMLYFLEAWDFHVL